MVAGNLSQLINIKDYFRLNRGVSPEEIGNKMMNKMMINVTIPF